MQNQNPLNGYDFWLITYYFYIQTAHRILINNVVHIGYPFNNVTKKKYLLQKARLAYLCGDSFSWTDSIIIYRFQLSVYSFCN